METTNIIHVTRQPTEDVSTAASRAACEAGTQLDGNLRRHGPATTPHGDTATYYGVWTKDGREVRVWEPTRDPCTGCGELTPTDRLKGVAEDGMAKLLCPKCRE